MAGLSDYKLKLVIDADGRTAKQELNSVYGEINKLGGGFTSTFGGAIPIAGAAAAAIAGIGLAAAGVGVTLFNLTKNASEFGSVIFDFQQKTGLAAATITTLKLAADNAGSSLESVGSGVAKFAKLLGEAKAGSDKAKETLAALGVTSTDLDTALSQVTKTIFNAKEGTDQITVSQKAFGKAGADLIPVVKQLGGDLEAATKEAERLGTTLTQADIEAADEFGDTLGVLNAQLKVAAIRFGLELAPTITSAMSTISQVMAANQGVVREWGENFAHVANGTIMVVPYMTGVIEQLGSASVAPLKAVTLGVLDLGRAWDFATLGLSAYLRYQQQVVGKLSGIGGKVNVSSAEGGGSVVGSTGIRTPGSGGGGGGRGGGGGSSNAEKLAREAETARKKEVQSLAAAARDVISIYQAGYSLRIAIQDAALARGETSELNHIREIGRIHLEGLNDEKRLNDDLLKNDRLNKEERKDLEVKGAILDDKIAEQKVRNGTAIVKRIQEETKEQNKLNDAEKERLQKLKEFKQQKDWEYLIWKRDQAERDEKEGNRKRREAVEKSGGLRKGIADGAGISLPSIFGDNDQILSQADFMKAVYADVADFAGGAIGSMVDGLTQMGVAWIMTGEFSAQAALQMLASTAFSIATQAGMKAIFEYAEGMAALGVTWGVPNPSSIAHFAAAATYGTIAAVAGGAGIGLALGARAAGGGGGGAGGGSGAQQQQGRGAGPNGELSPYSRTSETAYYSGRRDQDRGFYEVLRDIRDKLNAARPGDVFIKGMEQSRGAVSRQVVKEVKSTGVGRDLGRAMGLT